MTMRLLQERLLLLPQMEPVSYTHLDVYKRQYVKKAEDEGYIVINRDTVGGSDHIGGTTPQDSVEMVSNAKGEIKIYGLDTGIYYLKETEAPTGCLLYTSRCV